MPGPIDDGDRKQKVEFEFCLLRKNLHEQVDSQGMLFKSPIMICICPKGPAATTLNPSEGVYHSGGQNRRGLLESCVSWNSFALGSYLVENGHEQSRPGAR